MSGYRIAAALVAAIAAALLLWVVILSFGPETPVVPTATVTAARSGDAADAGGVLAARTRMQDWRARSGPSAGAEPPAAAVGDDERLRFERGGWIANPAQLVDSWTRDAPRGEPALHEPRFVEGISNLPYPNAEVFEQPQGRGWRNLHNDQVRYGGGWIIFGMILALALFLLFRGRIPLAEGYSGERIRRFNSIERGNHWMTAASFLAMGVTGLVLIYAKPLLLPLIGLDATGSLARWSAWLHMALAIPFVLGVAVMIALWLKGNLPDRYDWPWLKRFGGFLDDSPDNPPADRFNTGQKIVFWGVVLGGLSLLATGVVMMFPFFWLGYDGMQWAQTLHAVIALLMVALILGHIYIGTIGMEDAFAAMWSGLVDANWLKEHHSVWYEKITGRPADTGEPTRPRDPAGQRRA